ncbi:MAG: C-terminal binding protein [Halosimplex sp.]
MEVVASDDPMIDADLLGERLGADATVTVAETDTEAATIGAAQDAEALIVDVSTPVSAGVLAACKDLRIVARAGVGIDNVDVRAAAERGVVVTNVPEYCTEEVATHTVSLALACLRKLGASDRDVKGGGWDWRVGGETHRLSGLTFGFLSYGPIARRVREITSGFGVEYVAHDPYVDAAAMRADGVEAVAFDELLDRTDLLSVNAPLTEETREMVDAAALEHLPDRAVVVNTGRGGVVDEGALADALEAGEIAAAGLDVFADEPPEGSPLFDRENAILTPHAAWYSEEARDELNRTVAANVRAALDGETPPDRVDPELGWV